MKLLLQGYKKIDYNLILLRSQPDLIYDDERLISKKYFPDTLLSQY
jgi:hypothetical protein